MANQQFSLRWNNHTNNLVQVMLDHFEREQMVDVTLSCQGKFLKAHKMVLGACSPYFEELFIQHESTPHPIIIMNGFEYSDIQSLVEFMYKGEVRVSEAHMNQILTAAENLQVRGLCNVRSQAEEESSEGSPAPTSEVQPGKVEIKEPVVSKNSVPAYKRRRRIKKTAVPNKKPESIKSEGTNGHAENHYEQTTSDDEGKSDDLPLDIKVEPPLLRDIDAPCKNSSDWDLMKDMEVSNGYLIDEKGTQILLEPKEKIPRPPNAFMIFANEWRRKLANQFCKDSNKEISVRLGVMWKSLPEESKAIYYSAAKQANEDHKRKYPDYHYNPKEARLRKRWKAQNQQQMSQIMGQAHAAPHVS